MRDDRLWVAVIAGSDSDWGWVDGDMIRWSGSQVTTPCAGVDAVICASEDDARILAREAICIAAAAAGGEGGES